MKEQFKERLQELDRLEKLATPGEWEVEVCKVNRVREDGEWRESTALRIVVDGPDFDTVIAEWDSLDDNIHPDILSNSMKTEFDAIVAIRNNARLLIDEGLKLVEEVERLEAWKREAIAVESTWDVQAIGKLIGTPLGGDIRAGVQPYIERLRELLGNLAQCGYSETEGIDYVELQADPDDVKAAREFLSQGGQS